MSTRTVLTIPFEDGNGLSVEHVERRDGEPSVQVYFGFKGGMFGGQGTTVWEGSVWDLYNTLSAMRYLKKVMK